MANWVRARLAKLCTFEASAICETDRVTEGVWLVIGVQASGKSTVADLLAHQFERGVHIRGGQFYRWAVSGWALPWSDDSEEDETILICDTGCLRWPPMSTATPDLQRLSWTIFTGKTCGPGCDG